LYTLPKLPQPRSHGWPFGCLQIETCSGGIAMPPAALESYFSSSLLQAALSGAPLALRIGNKTYDEKQ